MRRLAARGHAEFALDDGEESHARTGGGGTGSWGGTGIAAGGTGAFILNTANPAARATVSRKFPINLRQAIVKNTTSTATVSTPVTSGGIHNRTPIAPEPIMKATLI